MWLNFTECTAENELFESPNVKNKIQLRKERVEFKVFLI